ncbi:hypothetical protein C8K30_10312 [Promicromonospora sp. AC04]|uniref:hypothetical protein n=1 Tax=Promicromonospora sp. AC04 TaxID=2135723 RepID=UPI000D3CF50E|nr:hypothetical protein [Promicromonospora sp. AC04]PUB28596.1 hypothetical protein C8K30_10312 [Promicromonospora sp. AC04]
MAEQETTRQVNKRAIEALEQTHKLVDVAVSGARHAAIEMEDLRSWTEAHAPVADALFTVKNTLMGVLDDVERRLNAEREGKS